MLFSAYLDLDHGIESVSPGEFLVFAGGNLLQFVELNFEDPELDQLAGS